MERRFKLVMFGATALVLFAMANVLVGDQSNHRAFIRGGRCLSGSSISNILGSLHVLAQTPRLNLHVC